MNVRLVKDWQWQSGLLQEDVYYINQYHARIHMHTTTMSQNDHGVAYGRMQYWFQEIMQDSVMLTADHHLLAAYQATEQRTLVFPEDPVDQLVGIMLCHKLNAICEQRLVITDVEIMSNHGDNMIYLHNESEASGPLAATGWWSEIGPCWSIPGQSHRSGKVVSLARTPEWNTLQLDWAQDLKKQDSSVLFADFNRDDDQ